MTSAKLEKAGFDEVEVVERAPLGVDDLALYPLFTTEVLELMQDPGSHRERQLRVAVAIVVRARALLAERVLASQRVADDERVHLVRALVSENGLEVVHVPDHRVLER